MSTCQICNPVEGNSLVQGIWCLPKWFPFVLWNISANWCRSSIPYPTLSLSKKIFSRFLKEQYGLAGTVHPSLQEVKKPLGPREESKKKSAFERLYAWSKTTQVRLSSHTTISPKFFVLSRFCFLILFMELFLRLLVGIPIYMHAYCFYAHVSFFLPSISVPAVASTIVDAQISAAPASHIQCHPHDRLQAWVPHVPIKTRRSSENREAEGESLTLQRSHLRSWRRWPGLVLFKTLFESNKW